MERCHEPADLVVKVSNFAVIFTIIHNKAPPGGEHHARPGEHLQQPLVVESRGEVRSRRAAAGAEELADLVVGGLVLGQ